MLDTIKKALFASYSPQDVHGLFLSAYDKSGNIQGSYWVIQTDKTLADTLDLLYQGLFSSIKGTKYFIIDVVIEIQHEQDIQKILTSNPGEYGVCIVGENSKGSMLPATTGISDMKQVLQSIKQKNNITGKVQLYLFQTNRIEIKA